MSELMYEIETVVRGKLGRFLLKAGFLNISLIRTAQCLASPRGQASPRPLCLSLLGCDG